MDFFYLMFLYYAKKNEVSTRGTGEKPEISENGGNDVQRVFEKTVKHAGKRKKQKKHFSNAEGFATINRTNVCCVRGGEEGPGSEIHL